MGNLMHYNITDVIQYIINCLYIAYVYLILTSPCTIITIYTVVTNPSSNISNLTIFYLCTCTRLLVCQTVDFYTCLPLEDSLAALYCACFICTFRYIEKTFPGLPVVFFSSFPRDTSSRDDLMNFDPAQSMLICSCFSACLYFPQIHL